MQILEIFSTHIGSKAANQSPLLANKNYLRGIHIEHEFIILEFLCFSALRSQLQICIQIVSRSSDQCFPIQIVLRSPLQIFVFLLRICVFQIVISKPCLLLPSDVFFFLWIQFISSSNRAFFFIRIFVLQILLKSKKLEFHMDKLLHLNTRTRVFEARFCHRT